MHHKLTKSYVDSISLLEEGQEFHRDTELKGFALRVGRTAKTYVAETKVAGKVRRVTIGKHGPFTPESARQEAKKHLANMACGINPNDIKAENKLRAITLGEVLTDFLSARKSLKDRTIYDYKRMFGILPKSKSPRNDVREKPILFSDWHNKPIKEISKDMVEKRHALIGKRSEAQANLAMRLLRSLFNFAIAKYEDSKGDALIAANPVARITQTRAWYKIDRRKTVIKQHDIEPWMKAVLNLKNAGSYQTRETTRDYLLLLLFTGFRREEAASLIWSDVDLKAKTITARDTKNHLDHTLPLSDYLYDMLKARFDAKRSEYVFPGSGAKGYIVEPKKIMARITAESGVDFIIHDLRRTFTTIADSLDTPAYALKHLINHKSSNDVTLGYIINEVERLRVHMQRITDHILKSAGLKKSADVVPIEFRAA